MRKHILAIFIIIALLGGTVWSVRPARPADAQGTSSQLLMAWQADAYAPSGFTGKILPASGSAIRVGVDLFEAGRRVDLAPYKVFWYLDDKFYQGASGLTQIGFTAPHFIGATSVQVRVVITNYGSGPGKTLTIPIVPPEAVIQSSAPSLSASAVPFTLQAFPYFFNVKDPSQLVFGWTLNGSAVGSERSLLVTEEMGGQGRSAQVQLSVRNPTRPIERITSDLTIFK